MHFNKHSKYQMALILQSKDAEWLNDDVKPSMCCLLEICPSFKDSHNLSVKIWAKVYQANK